MSTKKFNILNKNIIKMMMMLQMKKEVKIAIQIIKNQITMKIVMKKIIKILMKEMIKVKIKKMIKKKKKKMIKMLIMKEKMKTIKKLVIM
jgi:hypothetical protein